MSKITQRLTSLALSTIMILSSVSLAVVIQEPITVHANGTMTKNNMVLGTQKFMDLSEFNEDATDRPKPEYQMLRFSLIQTDKLSSDDRGEIYTGDGIDNNPVSIANPNGGLEAYNDSIPYPNYKVRQLVNYNRYSDELGDITSASVPGHKLNTRRDYTGQETGVIFYDANSTTVLNDPGNPSAGSHEEISGFEAYFVPIAYDEAMPQVIVGSDDDSLAKSIFQLNPPEGHDNWSSIDSNLFFEEYTQASINPKDIPDISADVNVTHPVPDCIYRILAFMLGMDSPYDSQEHFDQVEAVYNDLVASGKCEILVEPLMCFENTGDGGVIDTYFSSSVKYVALSSAEVGMLDDCASGINYGYTDQHSLNIENPGNNNYNFFTSPDSKLVDACKNLYNSLLLKKSAWECSLWALSDGIDNGSMIGAGNQFITYLKEAERVGGAENFLMGVRTGDFGSALGGREASVDKFQNDTADNISGEPGPYWDSIFYYQVYKDIAHNEDYDPSVATAPEYTLGDYPDPASYINFGGMSIIKPIYSTLDIKTNLTGVGESSESMSINGIETPIYEDSYTPTEDAATLTFKASMGLNFEDNATNWTDKVLTNIDNGDRSNGTDTDSPTYLYVSCGTDDGEKRTPKELGEISESDVYIPTYTKAEVTVTYVDDEGNPITYTQANGEEGNGNTSIAIDPSTPGKAAKMFLDNMAILGWHKDAATTEDKAIPYTLSLNNSSNILSDSISKSYMIDAGFDDTTEFPNNITDTAQAGYITMRTPDISYIPENAAYFLVTLKANIGSAQTHTGSFESSHTTDSDLYLRSRPQYDKALADSGASVSTFYASYTDPDCPNYGEPAGSGVEIDYSNNTSQILIPIEGHDVSADSVEIVPTQIDVETGTAAYQLLNSVCINTTGSATDATMEAYGTEKTANTIYLFASTSPLDAVYAEADSKESLMNIESTLNSYASAVSANIIATTKIGGATNSAGDVSGSLRYISGASGDESDTPEGSIATWQVCSGSSDPFIGTVNNKITELVNNKQDPTVYLTAVYVINDKVLDTTSTTIPPAETNYSNNTVVSSVAITNNVDRAATAIPNKLACSPVVGSNIYQLKEYTDYMSTGTADPDITRVAGEGKTNYDLANPGKNFQYGGTLKIDNIPNSWSLGKRTVLEYVSDGSWTKKVCGTHGSGESGLSFPSSWYKQWRKSTGSDTGPVGGGRVIAANQYHDSDGEARYTPATQQILFKYLDLDTNEFLAGTEGKPTEIPNPNYYKFVIKTQIANYGFVTSSKATCWHKKGGKSVPRTRDITYTQYVLKDEQDSVAYTFAFDHNYAQSISNSVCYSIDSFLAPSDPSQQGKYSYMIEAGSRLGVVLRERVITDVPSGIEVPVYADAYFRDIYPGSGATASTKMNQFYNTKHALELTNTATVPLRLGVEYDSNKLDTVTSQVSDWAKSNASYSMLLAKAPELEEDLFTIVAGNSSGSVYSAAANTAGAKYKRGDSTCVPTTNVAAVTSSLGVARRGGSSGGSYTPVLGDNCYISPGTLVVGSSDAGGWGVATDLKLYDSDAYSSIASQYQDFANRFLMYKRSVSGGSKTLTTGEPQSWLHSTYSPSGPAMGSLYKVTGSAYVTKAGSDATLSNDFINVRYYKWEVPYKDGARGLYTDPDYPDSIKVNSAGQPTIPNQTAINSFIGTGGSSVVDEVDKEYGYCGLRIKLISYVAAKPQADAEYSDLRSTAATDRSAYARGIFGDLTEAPKMGSKAYGYTLGADSTSQLIGDCTDFNLVVIGSTSNRYSGSSNY